MPPKVEIKTKLEIKDLLSHQYDPADYSLAAFHEHYERLVKHRDDLREEYSRKKETRASLREPDGKTFKLQSSKGIAHIPSGNPSKGSRFSSLPDDDDGSSSSALTKPITSASLSKKELDKLPQHERKAAVRKIKEEIETMKTERKEQKRKDNKARKEAEDRKGKNDHRKTGEGNQDETNESGQDQG